MKALDQPLELLEVEVLAALLFADQRPLVGAAGRLDWRLDGAVTRMLLAGTLSGRQGERLVLSAGPKLQAEWVLLVGAGKRQECSGRTLHTLLQESLKCCRQAGFQRLGLVLPLDLQPGMPNLETLVPAAEASNLQLQFIDDAAMA